MISRQVDTESFARQVNHLRGRMDNLRQRAGETPSPPLLMEALADLTVTIEELRVAEEELRQQADELQASQLLLEAERRRYLELFEFAPDGYLVTSAKGVVLEANQAAGLLLGRPLVHVVGKPLAVFVDGPALGRFLHEMSKVCAEDTVRTWDSRLVNVERGPVEVEFTVAPARHALTGELRELRWRLHDITERKQAEQALQESRETLRALGARMEAVREEERARIARTVHDEIGAALTAIKLDLSRLRKSLAALGEAEPVAAELYDQIEATWQLIDTSMQSARGIAMELRPAILDDFGLVAALDWQCQEFQKRTEVAVALAVAPGDLAIDKATSTALFRIFQEVLTNVARHAGAKTVDVKLFQEDQSIVLEVRDDGRGIRWEEAAGTRSPWACKTFASGPTCWAGCARSMARRVRARSSG